MTIGLANSYESFLLFRLAIGIVGASFVITQYHTSVMFAPNVVGTANATTAVWGNLGGGVTQMAHAADIGFQGGKTRFEGEVVDAVTIFAGSSTGPNSRPARKVMEQVPVSTLGSVLPCTHRKDARNRVFGSRRSGDGGHARRRFRRLTKAQGDKEERS